MPLKQLRKTSPVFQSGNYVKIKDFIYNSKKMRLVKDEGVNNLKLNDF